MILIDDKPFEAAAFNSDYPEDSMERSIVSAMSRSSERYTYDTANQLKFELRMRKEIVNAANALNRSNLSFEVFRESKCNPDYWRRRGDGGFELKPGVKASDAIRDIFKNSSEYGTECATALQIVYYKALLEIFPETAFNRMFGNITLMNWHEIAPPLRDIGVMHHQSEYLPGDRRYFANPDVDPETPEWQGENVIQMGDGTYYGHGIGKHHAETIIRALNENRREGADREAYLMDSAARPDFRRLSAMYDQATGGGA